MRIGEKRHGTPSGWRRHKDDGEQPCDACIRAKAEYDKRWRSAPENTLRNRISARAQARAYSRLAKLHPGLYQAFYDEERDALLREAGLEVRTFGRNGQRKQAIK